MKRRQRKPVLDINGDTDSPRRRWPNERQVQNGSPSNPLSNLVGPYNSDSEVEDDKRPKSHLLNDKVNDFFKEIQSITPEDSSKNNQNSSMSHLASYWQECYDEQTGYPYYWHTETNQVTWEMPPELKVLQEKRQLEAAPHASHISQWSNLSNKYPQSQSNIPEGMIPKEVVVRNRNRQAGIMNKPAKPMTKTENSKLQGHHKGDSSDEGKIEMITSFGNDESESEESDREETKKKILLPIPKKPLVKPPSTQDANKSSDKPGHLRPQVGPALLPLHYGPQNRVTVSDKVSQNVPTPKPTVVVSSNSDVNNGTEEEILTRLKNQAKLLQCIGGAKSKSERDSSEPTEKDLKLSLVPGYEDDSDAEEEPSRKIGKPLFPISEHPSTQTDTGAADKLARRLEASSGITRIYDYKKEEATTESEGNADEGTGEKQASAEEESRTEQEAKANKFLESIDAPSKAFQRKRRIAFDVAPTKSTQECANAKEEQPVTTTAGTESSERRGLGFARERTASPEEDSNKSEADVPPNNKRSAIAFVKSGEAEEESPGPAKTKEPPKSEKADLRSLTEPIMEKLKFLSEGSPTASAVQVMAIQIQTLLCAWESGDLQETYLRNWLVGTGCELTRLEQTAAPPGWECQWDRSHKRYYYRNVSSGEAQWTYPETDIVGGTEEMELCTTPPPPEQEETPIIEMRAQPASLSSQPGQAGAEKAAEAATAEKQQLQPSEPSVAPPPPTISSPSPPPPPRIYAEDLKRSARKRKASPEPAIADSKSDDSSKEGKPPAEPLPPGVDPPEIAYTLPASALEAGVLYGAQQTNPIYAATLAGAGIPLLPHHHHTALMQGQLMHYNPAYHQHLHNQALVAARLSGQEAVQFMVAAEYARMYENNQVIAKPPMKMPHDSSLGTALNSFYSDIAIIEKSATDVEKEKAEARLLESASSPVSQVPSSEADPSAAEAKEKKKKKLKTGLGKKQKEMSSMVAKWQRAQKNYKECH